MHKMIDIVPAQDACNSHMMLLIAIVNILHKFPTREKVVADTMLLKRKEK